MTSTKISCMHCKLFDIVQKDSLTEALIKGITKILFTGSKNTH